MNTLEARDVKRTRRLQLVLNKKDAERNQKDVKRMQKDVKMTQKDF